jgi:aspartate carbamoyltransferase catalytic subunit
MSMLTIRHLLGLRDVPKQDIAQILELGNQFRDLLDRPTKKIPALKGLTVVNLFFEDSTRTRISFELAEKRLSADTVNFSSSNSSLKKGESLIDTVRNIEAMKVDLAVVRHKGTGVPGFLAANTNCQILNAGDGANEHPTQALLDMLTMQRAFGDLKGLRVAIVGDIRHSRVARSNCYGLKTMGADVVLCGPPTLMPKFTDAFDVQVEKKLEDAVRGADVVMALRLQKERQDDGLLPSDREYRQLYGITEERLRDWNPSAKILHPGPINRNTELDSVVADGPNSLILEQVTNGVAVRMASLYLLAGGSNA